MFVGQLLFLIGKLCVKCFGSCVRTEKTQTSYKKLDDPNCDVDQLITELRNI